MDAPELQVVEKPEVNTKALLKDLKGKQYLGAHEAIYWFTVEHPAPEGRIITHVDFEHSCVRAEVYVNDALVATGHSIGDGQKSLEKLETGAIRRALANAGYGTIAAMAEGDDEDAAKTQARAAMAAKDIPTEVAREKMGSGKNRRMGGDVKPAVTEAGQPADNAPVLTIKDLDAALGNILHRYEPHVTGNTQVVLRDKADLKYAKEEIAARGFKITNSAANWIVVELKYEAAVQPDTGE